MVWKACRLAPIAALMLAGTGCVTPEMRAARSTELAAATDAILERTKGRITTAHLLDCWTRNESKFSKFARDPVVKPDKLYTCVAASNALSALEVGDYVVYTSRHSLAAPVAASMSSRAPTQVVVICPFRVLGENVWLDYHGVPRRIPDEHVCRAAWSPPVLLQN
jgi:hypothetical protein